MICWKISIAVRNSVFSVVMKPGLYSPAVYWQNIDYSIYNMALACGDITSALIGLGRDLSGHHITHGPITDYAK